MNKCPCCGAEQRFGVWLTPMKTRILDCIVWRRVEGISTRELMTDNLLIAASTHKRMLSPHTIKMHVHQINEILEETDYKIVSRRARQHSYWQLVPRFRKNRGIK